MKRRYPVLVGLLILGILVIWFFRLNQIYSQIDRLDCVFRVEQACVQLQLADTPETREKGLSGRSHLTKTQGMLFDFKSPQTACIWMKDMNFPIDIIWLNDNKEIIQIKTDVSPETYPESFCANETRYVIEVAAGVAAEAGLRIGQRLKL